MSKSRLNIPLFKKVRDRIAAIPESYNQTHWQIHSVDSPCGTAACLAGETIICAAPSVDEGIKRLRIADRDDEVPDIAGELLGLEGDYWNDVGEHVIFWPGAKGWPEPYRKQFGDARDNKTRAKVAVAYLDHIIETGKVLE